MPNPKTAESKSRERPRSARDKGIRHVAALAGRPLATQAGLAA